jgi:hypothetical protein
MLLSNREGSFRTEGFPMESCRPAIIVSLGVTAHWAKTQTGEVAVKQESIPWQSFVFDAAWSSTIRNTSLGPPQKGGLGDDDFQLEDHSPRRSVPMLMQ